MLAEITRNELAALRRRLARARREGLFVVEGQRALAGVVAAGIEPELVLVATDQQPPTGVDPGRCRRVARDRLGRLSGLHTPPGLLAVCRRPRPPALDTEAAALVLVGIADPGNCGTLLRAAAAFAVSQVVVVGGVDPWAGKVVQAAAGALGHLAIHDLDGVAVQALVPRERAVALVVRGGLGPEELVLDRPWWLVGSEAHGLAAEWVALGRPCTLPMAAGVESLNAAMAAGIALYLGARA